MPSLLMSFTRKRGMLTMNRLCIYSTVYKIQYKNWTALDTVHYLYHRDNAARIARWTHTQWVTLYSAETKV